MPSHTVSTRDQFISDAIVPGDDYTVVLLGGVYELVVAASSYGSGTGIVVARVMPDGATLVEEAAFTGATAPTVLYLGTGHINFAVAADVTGAQVSFARCVAVN